MSGPLQGALNRADGNERRRFYFDSQIGQQKRVRLPCGPSGTSPHYLPRFATEEVVTTNLSSDD